MENYMEEVAKLLGVQHKSKPVLDQIYFYVESNGKIDWNYWDNDAIDLSLYMLGNCYFSRANAEADRDKWIAFYASDEVLEV